jgi:division protein CdvB (Snf7/Vps24/ESCRT-III family)
MESERLDHGFLKDWDAEPKEPAVSRLGDHFHHRPSSKEQVSTALYRLKAQQNKLEAAAARMQQHDKEIFDKCVSSQLGHDSARAAMYANECAEVRKMAKVTVQCQMALEQVSLRLETIQEFGDVASMMSPVANVVHSIKNQISGVMPEVGLELGQIGELLSSVIDDAGEVTGSSYDVTTPTPESNKILEEANSIAEQHVKDRFPELPSSSPASWQKTREEGVTH